MHTQEVDQQPIQIIDYEFKHLGMVFPTVITIFPTKGDTVKVTPEGWEFAWPRMFETQTMFRTPNLLGLLVRDQMRVYIDPNEIAKKIIEARKQEQDKRNGKENKTIHQAPTTADPNQGPATPEDEEGR